MAITQQHAEIVARSVAEAYERMQDNDPDEFSDQRVSDALWRATVEAMQRVGAATAVDETLLDVKSSFSYKASIRVSVTVSLLVATDRALWVARHDEGVAGEPLAVAYEAIRPVGKRFSGSVKVEHAPEGVVITSGRSTAEWLESLQTARPAQTAQWLTAAQAGASASGPGAGWHPDPHGRHQQRYWDGSRWTEHVSSNGAQAVDPV